MTLKELSPRALLWWQGRPGEEGGRRRYSCGLVVAKALQPFQDGSCVNCLVAEAVLQAPQRAGPPAPPAPEGPPALPQGAPTPQRSACLQMQGGSPGHPAEPKTGWGSAPALERA